MKDPTLMSYFGLMGDANQRKVAEEFKRPTTWGAYCASVSPDGCTTWDRTALRAP